MNVLSSHRLRSAHISDIDFPFTGVRTGNGASKSALDKPRNNCNNRSIEPSVISPYPSLAAFSSSTSSVAVFALFVRRPASPSSSSRAASPPIDRRFLGPSTDQSLVSPQSKYVFLSMYRYVPLTAASTRTGVPFVGVVGASSRSVSRSSRDDDARFAGVDGGDAARARRANANMFFCVDRASTRASRDAERGRTASRSAD